MVNTTGKVQSEGGPNSQGHGHRKVVSLRRIGSIPRVMSDDVVVAVGLPCADIRSRRAQASEAKTSLLSEGMPPVV